MDQKKRQSLQLGRSTSQSTRFSGLFKGLLGKKSKKPCIVLIDDDDTQLREMAALFSQQPGFEVYTAKDGIDGLVLIKAHAEELRLCLVDMVMPGLSGIEVLNRARAEPQVQDATFALTTEFSGGKAGQKKTLSHFQVNDDRGRPVNVLIKPLHASLVAELVKGLLPSATTDKRRELERKASEVSLGGNNEEWKQGKSRSDWSARGGGGKGLASQYMAAHGGGSRHSGEVVTVCTDVNCNHSPCGGSNNNNNGSNNNNNNNNSNSPSGSVVSSPSLPAGSAGSDCDTSHDDSSIIAPAGEGSSTPNRTTSPRSQSESPSNSPRRRSAGVSGNLPQSNSPSPFMMRKKSYTVHVEGINRSQSNYDLASSSGGSGLSSSPPTNTSGAIPRSATTVEGLSALANSGSASPSPSSRASAVRTSLGSVAHSPLRPRKSEEGSPRETGSPRFQRFSPRTDSPTTDPKRRGSLRKKVVEDSGVSLSVSKVTGPRAPGEDVFNSISSLNRETVPRSTSIDNLNWDDVAE